MKTRILNIIVLVAVMLSSSYAAESVIVNVDNFVRAETAAQFDRMLKMSGGVNKWLHFRQPTPLYRKSYP